MPIKGDAKRRANQKYRAKRLDLAKDQKHLLVQIHLPASLAGRIQRLYDEAVAKGTHSWRNKSHAYREIILKGFLALQNEPIVDEARAYLEARSVVEARSAQRKEAQSLFAQTQEEIEELRANGIGAEVQAQYFHTSMTAALRMSPTVWRDWLLKTLKDTYPELTNGHALGVKVRAK